MIVCKSLIKYQITFSLFCFSLFTQNAKLLYQFQTIWNVQMLTHVEFRKQLHRMYNCSQFSDVVVCNSVLCLLLDDGYIAGQTIDWIAFPWFPDAPQGNTWFSMACLQSSTGYQSSQTMATCLTSAIPRLVSHFCFCTANLKNLKRIKID